MKFRLPFAPLVALRFLREGRMQTLLILAGTTGGVAVIVFLTQLITQLQAQIVDRVLGSQAHVVIRPAEEVNRRAIDDAGFASIVEPRAQRLRSIDQWENIARLAADMPGVTAVSPVVTGPAFAVRGQASKSVALMGVDAERYRRIVRMEEYMVAGRFAVEGTRAVIGSELAKDLGIRMDDKLRVALPNGRDELLQVGGIFDIGNKDLNRRWVFVTLPLAQSLLDLPGGVSNLDLTVADIFEAQPVADRLRGATSLNVESWMQTNAQLLAALRNQSVSNNLIRSFVVIIVALGIASVLVVSVVQKQKEIGILRAMGASRSMILQIFLIQGAVVGAVGSVLGSMLAFTLLNVFSAIYRNADGQPLFAAELEPRFIAMAALVATCVGLLSALIPARRAARMDPVQAIRS
ncbi:ABC transporter permease [Zoogloea sp.]|jgi:lipoprotein-releasing system permease protein|uniref:ABC transporter permease n=1 Tax=Zoogloea sp. TaxID=49181 RepID=UPI002CE84C5E|nr:ABC transporter permease [Zoogloea sp.]HPI60285.1 ABC transporter permease [Zoogloea sp.]